MSAPSPPLPRDTEEATYISDQNMVFRSLQPPKTMTETPASSRHPKGILKRTKNKISTPRPTMKDGGRKRFSFSPSPDLKREFKKLAHIDSGEGGVRETRNRRNLLSDLSEVTDVVNVPLLPVVSSKDMELEGDESLNKINQDRRIVSYHAPTDSEISPASGDVAGDVGDDDCAKDNTMYQPWSKQDGPPNACATLVGGLVNLPEMNLGTKLLLESPLEPSHLEESHDSLAVGEHVVPKHDNILLLAQVDSAEMLDALVAQPLLAGDLPEVVQPGDTLATKPLPTVDQPLLALVANGPSPDEMANFMEIQLSPAGVGSVEGAPTAESHPPRMPKQAIVMPVPVAAYVPSYEEFPSLERGWTLKIRDTFETGVPHHGGGLNWSRNNPGGQAP